MAPAKHPHEVATRIESLLLFDKNGANTLGLAAGDVFYGNQDKIHRTPTVIIQAGETQSPLAGASNMVQRQHSCELIVFHARYDDNGTTELEAQQFAAVVADYLDANLQLKDSAGNNPIVIHGWVVRNSPGFLRVGDNKYRAVRLEWNGISKTRLGA